MKATLVDQRKVMIFGQDKRIFCQYIFNKDLWTCPDGKRQFTPRDEGQGVMLSSFCSRELEYGFVPTKEILFKAVYLIIKDQMRNILIKMLLKQNLVQLKNKN